MQSYEIKQENYNSWQELREQNNPLYKLLNELCGKTWYRMQGNGWRFFIGDNFNPYYVANNPDLMTDAQARFLMTEALYREGAQNVPFKDYIASMTYRTVAVNVYDGEQFIRFEVPDQINGWLNGIYIGVDLNGRSGS
jgi:hypothetical protein